MSTQQGRQSFHLSKCKVTVGRLLTCDITLDSETHPQMISRLHCSFSSHTCDDGSHNWILHDYSLNGTVVNGVQIGEDGYQLKTGDVIVFGRQFVPRELEYVFEDPAAVTTAIR